MPASTTLVSWRDRRRAARGGKTLTVNALSSRRPVAPDRDDTPPALPPRGIYAARGGCSAPATSGGTSTVVATPAGKPEMREQPLALAQRKGNPERRILRPGQQAARDQGPHEAARLAFTQAHQRRNIAAGHHAEQHRLFQERLHAVVQPAACRFSGDELAHSAGQRFRRECRCTVNSFPHFPRISLTGRPAARIRYEGRMCRCNRCTSGQDGCNDGEMKCLHLNRLQIFRELHVIEITKSCQFLDCRCAEPRSDGMEALKPRQTRSAGRIREGEGMQGVGGWLA